ncbi:antibiotic biosynthesis monooxygenase family protein [Caldimonas tepidiphila]|uniref:antibiotic biosynthesis monooxygenase family protein n=1 Tax=Caldimonas tepidiphila TaxID=2315841 RepID=UPI000E5B9386|nr:antibiotic biosynthesis monooxygenase [Caldimonas tepidiphila]
MSDERFAELPDAGGCWAVIFSSLRTGVDEGYAETAERMVELASRQPGFLGAESARGADGFGITVSYWRSREDIAAWRAHAEHALAREAGRGKWYERYALRVARVERDAGWMR